MIWLILAAAGAAYLAVATVVFLFQGRLVYFPRRELAGTPRDAGLAYEDVSLKTSDGLTLGAWYVPPTAADSPVVLHCHGNGGNISHRLELLNALHRAGAGVLIFDYRGYGRSEGSPDEQGTYRDARAAWDYLTNVKGLPAWRIVVHGQSLGGAVAAHLAGEVTPAGLILESAFTSLDDRGAEIYWFLPVRLMSRYHYPTRASLASVACPLLILHSPSDEIVPIHHGRGLFEAAAEPKRFVELTGGHNDGFAVSGDLYVHALRDFLRECMQAKTQRKNPATP
ncbi:MAG: alpha/beta hydrolase [Planctomycetota bacterium]|nr:alpha/beta hydrolase [Planctomycetota bacterium]